MEKKIYIAPNIICSVVNVKSYINLNSPSSSSLQRVQSTGLVISENNSTSTASSSIFPKDENEFIWGD